MTSHRAISQDDLSVTAPVVVELYTSQSCSSCPPADKVLGELARNDNVIALGCHVTYWNHLHWKDTLSNPECTTRQRQFNNDRHSNRIYTPQMVVNGEVEFVGSRGQKAASEVNQAQAIVPIILQKNGSNIAASLSQDLASNDYVYEWIEFDDKFHQDIPSGENRGRSITYSNPVRSITYGNDLRDYRYKNIGDHVVLLIRVSKAGKIIAAGKL